MLSKNNPAKELFLKLSGKYSIKRTIENHGYGKGIVYFLEINPNELLYKEELSFNYHGYDNQIIAMKEYKYIFENNGITKYFTDEEKIIDSASPGYKDRSIGYKRFYRLDFLDNTKAIGSHLCGRD
ncbi:MAG: DUF6314 family protein, partial [Rickettsia endosymbiont of Pentastiridius leporinus]